MRQSTNSLLVAGQPPRAGAEGEVTASSLREPLHPCLKIPCVFQSMFKFCIDSSRPETFPEVGLPFHQEDQQLLQSPLQVTQQFLHQDI